MIKPRINNFVSPDVPAVWNWVPNAPEEIDYYLEMMIGSNPERGDLYGVKVVSPQSLLMRQTGPAFLARHHLLVLDYSWRNVLKCITDAVDSCSADNWAEVSQRLARYFHWEFEDYHQVDKQIGNIESSYEPTPPRADGERSQ